MKKLFLFTVALLTSLMVGATTHTLEPGENKIGDAMATLVDGDVIELQTGTYYEWHTLEFSTKVTLKAAEGATPIVQPNVIKIKNDFEANGITFINLSKNNYLLRTDADVAGTIAIKNCNLQLNAEVTDPVPYIYLSSNTVGNLVIDNCTFAPNAKTEGAIVYGLTTVNNFTMTNSTAVACGGTDLAVYMSKLTNAVVDHCTFYNCGARVLYLKGDAMASCAVSNCIVANAANVENYCIATYAGTVDNCVYYNTTAPRGENATVTGCINADPLFADSAKGDFSFPINSPLAFAATDGSHIGDPRWSVNVSGTVDITTQLNIENQACGTAKAATGDETLIEFYPSKESSKDTALWAGWVVNTEALAYKIAADVTVDSDWSLNMFLCDIVTGALVNKYEYPSGDSSAISPVDLGTWDLSQVPAGQYLLKVKNKTPWGNIQLKSLTFTYAGGAVVAIQGTLPIGDAVMNGNRVSKTETEISWNNSDNDASSYVTWNVNATKIGQYDVILNENTGVGHNYTVSLMNGSETLTSVSEGKDVWKQGEINLGKIVIEEEGSYTIKLTNTTFYSSSKVTSLSLNYLGGTVVTIPGILQSTDAILGGDNEVKVDEEGYICFSKNANVPNCYAKWNTSLTNPGRFAVKINVATTNGHKYKVQVLSGETLIAETAEPTQVETQGDIFLGEVELTEIGAYTIQLTNETQWSNARVKSVTIQPLITIEDDDSDIDFSEYDGQTVNVQLQRTFKANMYNPICLPFAVSDELFQQIFKSPKSFVLTEATLENQKLFVELAENYGIYQGTPVMVKPTEDVVNPIFENVQIKATSPNQTTEGVLRLQGSFASHIIDNPQNALLVGANNTLFFPNDETPYIKSMRAYFILVGQAAKAPIKAACFREPGNAPTWMPIVGAETEKPNGKFIRDGRFVIVREGKEYNAQGVEL